jgi:hypothetical protein
MTLAASAVVLGLEDRGEERLNAALKSASRL